MQMAQGQVGGQYSQESTIQILQREWHSFPKHQISLPVNYNSRSKAATAIRFCHKAFELAEERERSDIHG